MVGQTRSGRCAQCGFDWEVETASVQAQLADIGSRYRQTISSILPGPASATDIDAALRTRPAEGVWSTLEYLAHVRDVLPFYEARIRRVLSEERPVMTVGVRFAELAEIRHYRDDDVAAVLDELEQRATAITELIDRLTPDDWLRVGIGSEGGERTISMLAKRLAHEAHHHLQDIEAGAKIIG